MRPIWFFVGLLLLVIGAIVTLNGLYLLFQPSPGKTVLAELHPSIWWGGIMLAGGLTFYLANRKKTVE